MMKKINLLYILCCFSFLTQAQIQEEDFNATTLPTGWSVSNTNSCSWEFGYTKDIPFINPQNPVKLASGSVIFDDNKCGAFKNNVATLEGPEVNLVARKVFNAQIELTYNHQAFVNSGKFSVEVWDGGYWQNVLTVTSDSPAKNSRETVTTSIIDVSDYINSAFKVKFVYDDENTRTYGVAIDHYKLINTAEGLTQHMLRNELVVFPNPVNDQLNILSNKDISIVNVYNSIGQLIVKQQPSKLSVSIPMGHLNAGVYILQVETDKRIKNFKVVKQ